MQGGFIFALIVILVVAFAAGGAIAMEWMNQTNRVNQLESNETERIAELAGAINENQALEAENGIVKSANEQLVIEKGLLEVQVAEQAKMVATLKNTCASTPTGATTTSAHDLAPVTAGIGSEQLDRALLEMNTWFQTNPLIASLLFAMMLFITAGGVSIVYILSRDNHMTVRMSKAEYQNYLYYRNLKNH
jgi:hypothetical protein